MIVFRREEQCLVRRHRVSWRANNDASPVGHIGDSALIAVRAVFWRPLSLESFGDRALIARIRYFGDTRHGGFPGR